jgi:hypothetical protein
MMLKLVQKSSEPLFLRDLAYLVFPLLLTLTILADYSYYTVFGGVILTVYYLQKQFPPDNLARSPERTTSKTNFISIFKGKMSQRNFQKSLKRF